MAEENADLKAALEEARRAREAAESLARELTERLSAIAGPAIRAGLAFEREGRGRGRPRHRDHFHGRDDEREPPASGTPDGVGEERALSLEGVRTVNIRQTAGKLIIRARAEGETPGVSASSNKTPPRIETTQHGDRLEIDVKLSVGWLFRRRQGATTTVRLIDGLEQVRVNNGAGEIHVQQLTAGAFDLATGAGEIKTFATTGTLKADTGAGRVQVTAHRGLARCDTGTGDVTLDIAEVVPGEYRANVGMGRAEVRLPAGLAVHIRANSGIGKARVDYPDAGEGAPTTVRVDTGIGEASVKARSPGSSANDAPPRGPAAKSQREGREAVSRRRRDGEELRVLQLLEQGKISTQEAADLIAALRDVHLPDTDE